MGGGKAAPRASEAGPSRGAPKGWGHSPPKTREGTCRESLGSHTREGGVPGTARFPHPTHYKLTVSIPSSACVVERDCGKEGGKVGRKEGEMPVEEEGTWKVTLRSIWSKRSWP